MYSNASMLASPRYQSHLIASIHSGLRSLNRKCRSVGDPEGVVTNAPVHDPHDFILSAGASVDDLALGVLRSTLTILIKATAEILTT